MRGKGVPTEFTAPMPKFLGWDSKRGFFFALVALLAPKGAAAGFFPVLALGGWSWRRSQQSSPRKVEQCRIGALAPRPSKTDTAQRKKRTLHRRQGLRVQSHGGQRQMSHRLKRFCWQFFFRSTCKTSSEMKTHHPPQNYPCSSPFLGWMNRCW